MMSLSEPRLSRASVGRLSLYLRCIEELERHGATKVSSSQLGEALGVSDAQVRRDIGALGNLGHPGVGYPARELTEAIRHVLGIDRRWGCILVGVGNLARALLRYRGFSQQGFRVVALFDADPAKVGQRIEELEVQSPDRLAGVIAATRAELGMLTVPAESAQRVADQVVAAGIKGILNFAPTVLRVPSGISLVSVDLTVQLEQLAFQVQLSRTEGTESDTR
ncbi:MAG: redox-sensing transcriptional repressor Rex [Gemmataceae bacterium]